MKVLRFLFRIERWYLRKITQTLLKIKHKNDVSISSMYSNFIGIVIMIYVLIQLMNSKIKCHYQVTGKVKNNQLKSNNE